MPRFILFWGCPWALGPAWTTLDPSCEHSGSVAPAFLPAEPSSYARSVFFSDCFFCEGLEMTLISLLWKVPISCPLLKKSFRTRRKCLRLSASEMYSALAQPKPCQGQRGAVDSSRPAPPAFLALLALLTRT